MCGFIIKGAYSKAQNKEQLGHFFRNLKPTDKNIIIGLVAGMKPLITVQLFDEVQAAALWDLQYEQILSKCLDDLKQTTPINKSAIMKIAEDVYVRRHRMNFLDFFFPYLREIVHHHDYFSGENAEQYVEQLVAIFSSIYDKVNSVSELRAMNDLQRYGMIKQAMAESGLTLFPIVEKHGTRLLETAMEVCINFVLGTSYPYVSNMELYGAVIEDNFKCLAVSETLTYSYNSIDLKYHSEALCYVSWDYSGQSEIFSVKPTFESFDAIVPEQHFDAVQVMDADSREIDQHYTALNVALGEYHDEINRFNRVDSLREQLLNGEPPRAALESLKEIYPAHVKIPDTFITQEYALEEFADTLRAIVEFIIRHIGKIIPMLIALAGAIAGYMLKRKLTNATAERIDSIHDAYVEKVKVVEKEMDEQHIHVPTMEELLKDPKDWEVLERAKHMFKYEIDKLILSMAPGYTEAGIDATVKAHFLVLEELAHEAEELSSVLVDLIKVHKQVMYAKEARGVVPLARTMASIVERSQKHIENNHHDYFPYSRKQMFDAIEHHRGHRPSAENNANYQAVNIDIEKTVDVLNCFWNATYVNRHIPVQSHTMPGGGTKTYGNNSNVIMPHHDTYCNKEVIGMTVRDPLQQLKPFEFLDSKIKLDFETNIKHLKSSGKGITNMLSTVHTDHLESAPFGDPATQVVGWPIARAGDIVDSSMPGNSYMNVWNLFRSVIVGQGVKSKSVAIKVVADSLLDVKRLYDRFLDFNTISRALADEEKRRFVKYSHKLDELKKAHK